MNLQDLPTSMADMRSFTAAYEDKHFRYTESNRKIADATVRIVQGWFPRFLHPFVQPTFAALINDKLRVAFGYQQPAGWFMAMTTGALWLRKWPLRWITFENYPSTVDKATYRSYPGGPPDIETVGPPELLKH